LTCPKAGVCWLQDLAYQLDVRDSDYARKSFDFEIDDSNGFIERDPNYCILCGKCVRVCNAQNTNILEIMGRGVGSKVTTESSTNPYTKQTAPSAVVVLMHVLLTLFLSLAAARKAENGSCLRQILSVLFAVRHVLLR